MALFDYLGGADMHLRAPALPSLPIYRANRQVVSSYLAAVATPLRAIKAHL